MKKYLLISLITLISYFSYAQCTSCTYTYAGGSGANFNLNTGEKLCITGNTTNLNLNQNGTSSICVAAGASWDASSSSYNFNHPITLNIYGTTTLNNFNYNGDMVINVYSGGVLNYQKADFNGNGRLTFNNSGTLNFTSTSQITLQGNGNQEKTINNLAGGVVNATATSLFQVNQVNGIIVNNGTFNVSNFENAEGNVTNNSTGIFNVNSTLNNHGEFKNYGAVVGQCTAPTCQFLVGDKSASMGFKNYSTGVVSYSGNTTFSGYVLNDGIIQINSGNLTLNSNTSMAGTGYLTLVNGVSSITNSGFCFLNSAIKFCDQNTIGNNFDNNSNPTCTAPTRYTIDCSRILNMKLIGFDFVKSSSDTKVRWIVETDEMQNKFDLEMSTDGVNFNVFQSVTDNRKGLLTYISNPVMTLNQKTYFRLKVYKKDGSYNYSQIIFLNSKSDNIKIYPNPIVNNKINLSVPGIQSTIVNIFTPDGKLILSKKLVGLTNYNFEIPSNIKGNVFTEVLHQGEIKQFKLQVISK